MTAEGRKGDRPSRLLARPAGAAGCAAAETPREAQQTCPTCNDTGKVFDCPQWPGCACPDGTIKPGCPGETRPCPACAELVDMAADAPSGPGDIFHHPLPAEGEAKYSNEMIEAKAIILFYEDELKNLAFIAECDARGERAVGDRLGRDMDCWESYPERVRDRFRSRAREALKGDD